MHNLPKTAYPLAIKVREDNIDEILSYIARYDSERGEDELKSVIGDFTTDADKRNVIDNFRTEVRKRKQKNDIFVSYNKDTKEITSNKPMCEMGVGDIIIFNKKGEKPILASLQSLVELYGYSVGGGDFFSNFDIDARVEYLLPNKQATGWAVESYWVGGTIASVKFTRAKIFYSILSDYDGKIVEDISSTYVRDSNLKWLKSIPVSKNKRNKRSNNYTK